MITYNIGVILTHVYIDLMIYEAIKQNTVPTCMQSFLEASYNFPFSFIVTDLYLTTYRCVFGTSSKLTGVFAITTCQ